MQPSRKFEDLVELVAILRKECPWDRKQTHESIKDNLIEEAYEAIEALDDQDFGEFKKELGLAVGETSEDGKYSLSCLRCVGACGLAPVVLVGEKTYGRVAPDDVKTIIEEYQEQE